MPAIDARILLRCVATGEATRPRGGARETLRRALVGERLLELLRYADGGRPRVARASADWSDLSFSGTDGLFAAAIARDRRVGVDVERIPVGLPEPELVEEALSTRELAETEMLGGGWEPFLRAWCRKEAVLKLLGVGLAIHPRRIEVGLRAAHDTALHVATPGGGGAWVLDLCIAPGIACAVASDAPLTPEEIRVEWLRNACSPQPRRDHLPDRVAGADEAVADDDAGADGDQEPRRPLREEA